MRFVAHADRRSEHQRRLQAAAARRAPSSPRARRARSARTPAMPRRARAATSAAPGDRERRRGEAAQRARGNARSSVVGGLDRRRSPMGDRRRYSRRAHAKPRSIVVEPRDLRVAQITVEQRLHCPAELGLVDLVRSLTPASSAARRDVSTVSSQRARMSGHRAARGRDEELALLGGQGIGDALRHQQHVGRVRVLRLRPVARDLEVPAREVARPVVLGAVDEVRLQRGEHGAVGERRRARAERGDALDEDVGLRHAQLEPVQVARRRRRAGACCRSCASPNRRSRGRAARARRTPRGSRRRTTPSNARRMCSVESNTYGSDKIRVAGTALLSTELCTRVTASAPIARELERVLLAAELARVIDAQHERARELALRAARRSSRRPRRSGSPQGGRRRPSSTASAAAARAPPAAAPAASPRRSRAASASRRAVRGASRAPRTARPCTTISPAP